MANSRGRRNILPWAYFDPGICRRIAGGFGILTTCILVMYEKYKINQILSKLVDASVLDIDRKRPDYIYIKYHIYQESMRKMKEMEQDNNWINVIVNPFGKWWKTFKHSIAWRLLNIAQKGDLHERLKAVRQLVLLDHLKDWDFQHLAQMCDSRTAISLARNECDLRWFLPVHKIGVVRNPKLILSDIQDLFEILRPIDCISYFMKKHFETPDLKKVEIDEMNSHMLIVSRHDMDLLRESVAFIQHLTKDLNNCRKIIENGGLTILMELRKVFAKDNETLATLCKCLANLSMVEEAVEDFFVTGWIGTLASWMRHSDVRLQVIASKALANLDHDDPNRYTYPPNVYLLYPRKRVREKLVADVVFIHGLLGGVFYTWRQRDRNICELGLYGKNAFYTSEVDDVFLVGESKLNGNKNGTNKSVKVNESISNGPSEWIKSKGRDKAKPLKISDEATLELVETLQMSAELSPEWEVAFPDCPIKSNCEEDEDAVFSVSGEKWINDDFAEDYTNCWPMDWLPEDFPNIRVIGIDYTSAVTQWSQSYSKYCPCEKKYSYLDDKSALLLDRLAYAKVGDNKPVIWIGHSMGGILCKYMLMKSLESNDPNTGNIARNTKGIMFLGVPHRGSSIARWKQHMQVILSPSIEVKELEEDCPKLLDLHKRFMKSLSDLKFNKVKIVSIAEGSPTMLTTFKFPLRIVTEESAKIDYGSFYVVKDDHLNLSKPIFRQSFLYQQLVKVIEKSIDKESPKKQDLLQKKNGVKVLNPNASGSSSGSRSIWNYYPKFFLKYLGPFG